MRSPSGRRPTARFERGSRGLAERVYDIAYSPDGKWMATASGDPGSLRRRHALAGRARGGCKPVRDLVETQDVVFAVAFSPDSKMLAAAGADRTIRIFEVESGKLSPRSKTTPTGSSTSPSAPTASGSPAPAATRQPRCSTSRRKSRS